MGKYTKAIEHFICFLTECSMWCRENHLTSDFKTAVEALWIADRLEQAITDEQTADCIIVDTECVNNKHDKEVWLNGYNQALVDVRGEENGK